MVNFYVIQIKLKRITLDNVPNKYKEAVRRELSKNEKE